MTSLPASRSWMHAARCILVTYLALTVFLLLCLFEAAALLGRTLGRLRPRPGVLLPPGADLSITPGS